MTYRRRTDANHAAIRSALRQCGWIVMDTSRAGNGCPDLFAGRDGHLVGIEIKDGAKPKSRRRFTEDQRQIHEAFALAGVQIYLVESVDEARALFA